MREALWNCLHSIWNILTWPMRAAAGVVRALISGRGGQPQQEDAGQVAITAEQQAAAAEAAQEDARKMLALISKILGMRSAGLKPDARVYEALPKATAEYLRGLTDFECATLRSCGKTVAALVLHGHTVEGVRSPAQVAATSDNVVAFRPRAAAPQVEPDEDDELDLENIAMRVTR